MANTKIPAELSSTPGIVDNSNATAITINSSENVGIGTDSPSSTLHIANSNGVSLRLEDTGSHNFRMVCENGVNSLNFKEGAGNTILSLEGNNQRVGIGTSSPSHQLHIKGPASAYAAMRIESASASHGSIINLGDSTDDDYGQIIQFASSAGEGGRMRFIAGGTETLNLRGGNVGIGTSNPSSGMQIKGDGKSLKVSSADYDIGFLGALGSGGTALDKGYFYLKNTGTTKIQLHSDGNSYFNGGNVSIGTTNNTHLLHLHTETDNAYAVRIEGSTNNASGVWTGLGIGGEEANTKSALLFEDIGLSYARGNLHLCVNGETNQNSATPSDAKLTVRYDGNVGIGTVSPQHKLQVFGSQPTLSIRDSTNGGGGTWTLGREIATLNFMTSDTTGMGPHAVAEIKVVTGSDGQASPPGDMTFCTGSYNSAAAEAGRFTHGKSFIVGNTAEPTGSNGGGSGFIVDSVGRRNLILATTSTSLIDVANFRNPNGTVGTIRTNGSSTSYYTSSDYRLKENVVTDWDATTRLKQLKPSRFNFIADADTTLDGFLAHEVQDIVPEATHGTKDELDSDGNPEYQGIDHARLVPLLTKALQEAMTKIEDLTTRIETLEE